MGVKEKLDILLRDLTLLQKYEEDLFSFLPLPTLFLSPLFVILEFNPAFEEISGYKAEEVIGKKIDFLFEEKEKLFSFLKEKKEIEGEEFILLTKENKKIPVSLFLKERKKDGEISGFFISLYSLEKIKEIERKIRETINVLEIRVRAKKEELEELSKILEEKVRKRKRELEIRIRELEALIKKVVKRELEMIRLKKENKKLRDEISKLKEKRKTLVKNGKQKESFSNIRL